MCICVRKNKDIIGSDNGLLPVQGQAITWTNTGILSIGSLGTTSNEFLTKIKQWKKENEFENVVCKMMAILSQSQSVYAQSVQAYVKLETA